VPALWHLPPSTTLKPRLFGNFAHPALSYQDRNLIGRALFNLPDLKLRHVQVLPLRNYREGVAPERKGRPSLRRHCGLQLGEHFLDAQSRRSRDEEAKACGCRGVVRLEGLKRAAS
jgi:hypothetical protein